MKNDLRFLNEFVEEIFFNGCEIVGRTKFLFDYLFI